MDASIALQAEAAVMGGTRRPPTLRADADYAEMRRVATDFEAFFLAQSLRPMFENLSPEDPFNGGFGEEMFRSLQVEEYGKAIANAGGIGIADAVVREMLALQGEGEATLP